MSPALLTHFPDTCTPVLMTFIFQFKRLQGKRNRGREEINFVEIKGDDQLSGAQQWMTKSLTEEKTMKSFSKVSVKDHLDGLLGRPCTSSDLLFSKYTSVYLANTVAHGNEVYTKLHGNKACLSELYRI